jgi:hypothetical protein
MMQFAYRQDDDDDDDAPLDEEKSTEELANEEADADDNYGDGDEDV